MREKTQRRKQWEERQEREETEGQRAESQDRPTGKRGQAWGPGQGSPLSLRFSHLKTSSEPRAAEGPWTRCWEAPGGGCGQRRPGC